MNVDSITVRMYNTGSVGDCFLYLFKKDDVVTFRMLIDCGGFNTKSEDITKCALDIKDTCGHLDLLIVTHQHLDHISGFNQARSVFDQINVNEVWMSWAEDESDVVSKILKEKYKKKLAELKASLAKSQKAMNIRRSVGSGSDKLKGIHEKRKDDIKQAILLLEFEEGKIVGRSLAGARYTNNDAMTYVKQKGKRLSYKLPGQVVSNLEGAEGIKFYILGPPRDEDLTYLRIDEREEEMYQMAATDLGTKKRIESLRKTGVKLAEGVSPFGVEYHLQGEGLTAMRKVYSSSDYSWRQVEEDSHDGNSDMAIALTRFMNNTSLAIALEFEDTRKVMLLPADAQSGNWMSWHRPEIKQGFESSGGRNIRDLLSKTVFYKAGHHLSHNGTASLSGLDLIPETDLVSFVPLIQDKVPSQWGGKENFPANGLYKKLIAKTKGRVVRTDTGLVTEHNATELRDQLSVNDRQYLTDNLKKGSCYYEYTIK